MNQQHPGTITHDGMYKGRDCVKCPVGAFDCDAQYHGGYCKQERAKLGVRTDPVIRTGARFVTTCNIDVPASGFKFTACLESDRLLFADIIKAKVDKAVGRILSENSKPTPESIAIAMEAEDRGLDVRPMKTRPDKEKTT